LNRWLKGQTLSSPQSPQVSEHLPFDARALLVRAAKTPITNGDPLARVRAIEQASDSVRHHYPYFFKKDPS